MVTLPFKPMLAGKAPADLTKLKFPVYVSPKLDGIRCIITRDGPVSRNLKPIANDFIREYLSGNRGFNTFGGFDGELIVGKPTGNDVMNRASSGVMRKDGEPDFTYHVFDHFIMPDTFTYRQKKLAELLDRMNCPRVVLVEQIKVANAVVLSELEERYVSQGYEGVMIRDPYGHYKYGRSTTKEGGLLKLKRFETHEAIVVGSVERMHNANEATKDALGRTKRSTAKAGKVATGTMGALECMLMNGNGDVLPVKFEIGTGFDDAQRAKYWKRPPKIVTFKCQGFTPDGAPRFPVFINERDERDMDATKPLRSSLVGVPKDDYEVRAEKRINGEAA